MNARIEKALSVIALLVLLAGVSGTGFTTWRCRLDGLAHSTCCCAKDTVRTRGVAAVNPADCCSIEQAEIAAAPFDLASGAKVTIPAAILATPIGTLTTEPRPLAWESRDSAHVAAPGRYLLLRKQAFLL